MPGGGPLRFLAPSSSGVPGPLSRQLALGPWGSGCAPAPLGCCWQGRPGEASRDCPRRARGRTRRAQTDRQQKAGSPTQSSLVGPENEAKRRPPHGRGCLGNPGPGAGCRRPRRMPRRSPPRRLLPAGTPDGTARPAASQTTRRCRGGRSNGHSASREPRRPGRPREPASRLRCGLLRRWTRARASGPGRSDRLIAGPQGSAAHDPARAILTPTATGLAPKAGRQDASTLFPELRSLKQAPPSGLPTGLDQGQEPGWTAATVPEVELPEAAGRGSWSLLSLSPSAPRLPFCQFERGFCHLPPRVTTSAGSHQDIRFPVLVTQGLLTFPPAERPPDTELIFSAQYQGHTQPCAGGGCGVERHRMGAPGSGGGEHSRASKVRSAQLALEASVSAAHASGGTHHRNDFDYLSIILASMDLRHRM